VQFFPLCPAPVRAVRFSAERPIAAERYAVQLGAHARCRRPEALETRQTTRQTSDDRLDCNSTREVEAHSADHPHHVDITSPVRFDCRECAAAATATSVNRSESNNAFRVQIWYAKFNAKWLGSTWHFADAKIVGVNSKAGRVVGCADFSSSFARTSQSCTVR
jgi:hypothetical protein